MEFFTRYGKKPPRPIVDCGETMTQQHFEKACNINNIMKRYKDTGTLPVNTGTPIFGDFSQITGYQEALNQVMEAQQNFNALPLEIQKKFGNDPGSLHEYLQDPKNEEEAIRLGLLNPKPIKDNTLGEIKDLLSEKLGKPTVPPSAN